MNHTIYLVLYLKSIKKTSLITGYGCSSNLMFTSKKKYDVQINFDVLVLVTYTFQCGSLMFPSVEPKGLINSRHPASTLIDSKHHHSCIIWFGMTSDHSEKWRSNIVQSLLVELVKNRRSSLSLFLDNTQMSGTLKTDFTAWWALVGMIENTHVYHWCNASNSFFLLML